MPLNGDALEGPGIVGSFQTLSMEFEISECLAWSQCSTRPVVFIVCKALALPVDGLLPGVVRMC